ncbi:MAG: tRNA epoxyqueuosine(34) reductase QueG [Alicyclobacillus herbarius]|uniref:tRNA epoxyqueuosine(34) reductase QueG n=1 Tax=Alicyclobacillus herbarius TaxID=122960 RepID=UPI0023551658|nr:tRNA epoxyqueuosine(34) reductase QueG [Alicyclobacillus herbarius]MCL6631371.1 tRNA epoxyqueuosine(34) reductase QueG [Alicyclobacillus herbarius]
MTELTQKRLQELGKQAGLDAVGATTADPFPELLPKLTAYAERGLTGFECSDAQQRVNPRLWYPEAKSLIAAAMAYLTEPGRAAARRHPKGRLTGQVTVYSYGQDYHHVLRDRLETLLHLIEQEVGHKVGHRIGIDTSPLVDRRVAERAGIGWLGKNCLFYTPEHGSFVFLGTLAVDIEVEPAKREEPSRCGSCTLCMEACPTGALIAPGVIDATRCLSYITQMKGIIPKAYRAAMGRRVWGCDTCQWACPENRDVQASWHAEYLPQGELEFPDLIEILGWSNRAFLRRYGHTAAAWRGVRTWQRNALIALGNCRRPEAIPHIIPFLRHDRPELRASAAWALWRIGGEEARRAVAAAYETEMCPEVREEMAWAATH